MDKITSFLSDNDVDEEVIDVFKENKVDPESISLLTDNQLANMGLTALGTVAKLREHCKKLSPEFKNEPRKKRSNFLKAMVEDLGIASSTCTSATSQVDRAFVKSHMEPSQSTTGTCTSSKSKRIGGRPRSSMRDVSIGLRVRSTGDKKYNQVKAPLGDGNLLTFNIPCEATYEELMAEVKETFFPNGTNFHLGDITRYSTDLVNASNQFIKYQVDSEFTLRAYMDVKKLKGSIIRLHLLCSDVTDEDIVPMEPRVKHTRRRPKKTQDTHRSVESTPAASLASSHEALHSNIGNVLLPTPLYQCDPQGTTQQQSWVANSTLQQHSVETQNVLPPAPMFQFNTQSTALPQSCVANSTLQQHSIETQSVLPPTPMFQCVPQSTALPQSCIANSTVQQPSMETQNVLPQAPMFQCVPQSAALPQSCVANSTVQQPSMETQSVTGEFEAAQGNGLLSWAPSSVSTPLPNVPSIPPPFPMVPSLPFGQSCPGNSDKQADVSLHNVLAKSFNELIDKEDDFLDPEVLYQPGELQQQESEVHAPEPEVGVAEILNEISAIIGTGPTVRFIVRRRHVFRDTLTRLTKANSDDLAGPIFVKFISEQGKDEGGPKREFFTLFFQQMLESGIMDGGIFVHDGVELLKETYKMVGWMIIMSLAHGGPPPNLFSRGTTSYLLHDETRDADIDDIPDSNALKQNLKTLMAISDEDVLRVSLDDLLPDRFTMGYMKPTHLVGLGDLETIRRIMCHKVVIQDVKSELDQCVKGLRLFDAREMMQKNYRGFHNLLSVSSQKLTLDDMNDLLEVRFSEEGTNFRDKEIDVIYAWTNFLQDVEAGSVTQDIVGTNCNIQLEDILQFVTGLRLLPPLGFPPDKRPQIVLDHVDTSRLIHSNTCASLLHIPVSQVTRDPETFKKAMVFALCNHQGFGQR